LKYIPQFDALRSLAVLLTVIAHWFPAVGWPLIPYSWYGVQLFFTLSGFLITYILLESKYNSIPIRNKIKNFFARRMLRLFPIYYLFLLFFIATYLLLGLKIWKPSLGINLLTYTLNFNFNTELKNNGAFEHIWSLCVEEQFYLFWPWLVFFLNKKWLLRITIILIVSSILLYIPFNRTTGMGGLPILHLHTLGIGCLLAQLKFYQLKLFYYIKKHIGILFLISFTGLLTVLFYPNLTIPENLHIILRETFLVLSSLTIVSSFLFGKKYFDNLILNNTATRYIGKISYGIYLYHMPIPILVKIIISKMNISHSFSSFQLIAIYTLVTLLISSLSFKYIESRFLNLKSRFSNNKLN
jgi:peptidoglycan/LPS O-acetylase OafA/YrhL